MSFEGVLRVKSDAELSTSSVYCSKKRDIDAIQKDIRIARKIISDGLNRYKKKSPIYSFAVHLKPGS